MGKINTRKGNVSTRTIKVPVKIINIGIKVMFHSAPGMAWLSAAISAMAKVK